MPVSPADFEFYSRMTGQPIPNTPAGRMAIAPQVYNMRRGGGGFGRVLRGAAKGALAAGALAGAGALALATQEEMAKTGGEKKAKVTENLTDTGRTTETTPAGQKVTVSATDSEVAAPSIRDQVQDFVQGFRTDSGEELVGTAATPEQIQAFRNRYSGQTQIPVASPEVENESLAAQRASVQAPTEPRVGVRQDPSSGVIKTDLSNVAAVEGGRPAKEMNPELSAIRQQVEMYEGSPEGSPFQAAGALGELAKQSKTVKATVGDLPKSIRGDVAVFLSNLGGGQAAAPAAAPVSAEPSARSIASEFQQQLGRMSERDQVQYQGGLKGSAPQGVYGALESGQDIGDVALGGLTTSKEAMQGMMERGNVLASGIPQTQTVVPGPTDPITGDYRPFVSNKGREIGALLKQSQEARAAAAKPVTLGEIAGDVVSALNPFKDRKAEAQRRQQAEQLVIKSHGDVKDPVQRQKLIDFYMKQK